MLFSPIRYHQPVFRPPGEASSLILQVTLGCSWNRCAFCEMYRAKQFCIRPAERIEEELQAAAAAWPDTRRIFLADGDPLILSTPRLLEILQTIRRCFPRLHRLSAYASPRNLESKSVEELRALREAGLSLLYLGIESGDDDVLRRVQKGETAGSIVAGLNKAGEAGLRRSVMILLGLGGQDLSEAHAVHSAEAVNLTQPEYLSTLVLSFPCGTERFRREFDGPYRPLSLCDHLREMRLFLSRLKLKRSIFRSDHISNVLELRGALSRDQESLIARLDDFRREVAIRPEVWEKQFRDRDQSC